MSGATRRRFERQYGAQISWGQWELAPAAREISADGQISIFMLYLALRTFALVTHSPTTSDLAFDILACGACILFPRLVFFLIKDHVVIIAVSSRVHLEGTGGRRADGQLKAMVARFLGFMGLTCECFDASHQRGSL